MEKLENKQYLQNVTKDGLLICDLFVCETQGSELNIYQSGYSNQYHTVWYIEEKIIGTCNCKMIAKIHSLEKGMYLELYNNEKLSLNN